LWPSLIRVNNIIEYRGLTSEMFLNNLPHELAQMVVDASTNICDATIWDVVSKSGREHFHENKS